MAVQSYTITSAAPTQPASNSYTLAVDNPKVKISGIKQPAEVAIRLSMDGNDPAAADQLRETVVFDDVFELKAKTGNKVVFVGSNVTDNITVEIESS